MKKEDKTIVIAIGNCGREDDGLGWAFLDQIKHNLSNNFDIEYRYQLQVEDAELISNYKKVYFVDACKNETKNGFFIKKCLPIETYSFTSHALSPETILHLTTNLYHKKPESFIVGISGKSFQLKMGLTDKAITNLQESVSFFEEECLSK